MTSWSGTPTLLFWNQLMDFSYWASACCIMLPTFSTILIVYGNFSPWVELQAKRPLLYPQFACRHCHMYPCPCLSSRCSWMGRILCTIQRGLESIVSWSALAKHTSYPYYYQHVGRKWSNFYCTNPRKKFQKVLFRRHDDVTLCWECQRDSIPQLLWQQQQQLGIWIEWLVVCLQDGHLWWTSPVSPVVCLHSWKRGSFKSKRLREKGVSQCSQKQKEKIENQDVCWSDWTPMPHWLGLAYSTLQTMTREGR